MSVHEFYRLKAFVTLERVNSTEWSEKKRNLISKTAMFGCCKLSLYGNDLVMRACGLFLAMIEMTGHVNNFFDLWQSCNFSGIEALEFSCIYTLV